MNPISRTVAWGAAIALLATALIHFVEAWGWLIGVVVAGGAIVGYVASRTIGLAGIPAEPDAWLEPWGVASLVAEGIVAMLFLIALRARSAAESER